MFNEGYGLDDLSCPEGEEWDFNAMACVTAGQAVIPAPAPPQNLPVPTAPPSQSLPVPVPAPLPQTFFQKYKTPIIVVGAILVTGALAYWVSDSGGSSATPNPIAKAIKKVRRKLRFKKRKFKRAA